MTYVIAQRTSPELAWATAQCVQPDGRWCEEALLSPYRTIRISTEAAKSLIPKKVAGLLCS